VSRAFVNEDQADRTADVVPERIIGGEPNYVTPRGLRALEERLGALQEERKRVLALPEDDERRAPDLARIERDLRYFQARVESAILVDQSHLDPQQVHFGSEVTVADDAGEEHAYTIVGEDEADLARGLISWTSPLARSLINAREGEVVTWKRPSGDKELEVVRVRNASLD
jgi:transcription elongation GreA/GreB family factor